MKTALILLLSVLLLAAGCSTNSEFAGRFINKAKVNDVTVAGRTLGTLPAPERQLAVVVYDFQDQTGQLRQNDTFAEYSSAVTKGGLAVLVKALMDTSDGKWFMVAERGDLSNLLKERQIIRAMRSDYALPDGRKLGELPALIYGGMLLEGGIIFYDSNVLTGGAAAGYFGISGSAQYRRDMVSVYLRAVDINNGKVILAVNSSKTVFSYALNAGVTRYLALDKLLQAETGFTVNEPSQFAVRQAIETSVYSLIMEGALRGMWGFQDRAAGRRAVMEYVALKNAPQDGEWLSTAKAAAPTERVVPPSSRRTLGDAPPPSDWGFFSWLGL